MGIEIQRRKSSAPTRRVGLGEQHVVAKADQPPHSIGLSFKHGPIEILR
jgi:hypothetical protein